MRKQILVVGSINLDLVASVERIPALGETLTGRRFETFFGGKGANQAVGVARLGHPVAMIGRVGDDEFGARLRRGLSDAGVRTAAVKRTPGVASGIALITVASHGRNTIVVIPGANGSLTPKDLDPADLSSAGIILTQLETPLEIVAFLADFASSRQIPLMLDPAPARKLPVGILRKITWLTPNETETCTLCGIKSGSLNRRNVGQYARRLLEKGPKNVVIKLGARGAFWADSEGA
ncbi:MAG TPA: ribokinase, partial [Terriglobia bacterium]|nr:ribokinase [Terriglobia bacterium]